MLIQRTFHLFLLFPGFLFLALGLVLLATLVSHGVLLFTCKSLCVANHFGNVRTPSYNVVGQTAIAFSDPVGTRKGHRPPLKNLTWGATVSGLHCPYMRMKVGMGGGHRPVTESETARDSGVVRDGV